MIDERKKEMKKQHFEMESDGFYGAYWKCKTDSKYVWHFNLQENIQRNVLNAFEI